MLICFHCLCRGQILQWHSHMYWHHRLPCVNGNTSFPWESKTLWLLSLSALGVRPLNGSSRKMAQTTCIQVSIS